jgi:hypothetical protein
MSQLANNLSHICVRKPFSPAYGNVLTSFVVIRSFPRGDVASIDRRQIVIFLVRL